AAGRAGAGPRAKRPTRIAAVIRYPQPTTASTDVARDDQNKIMPGSVALRTRIDGLACRLPAVAWHQAPPFQHLPAEKARHSEHEIGAALDERQRNGLFWRNSKCRAQHDERAFLRPERTGDGKRRPANRMQQTFDDERLADAHGMPHEREHDRDFGHADGPSPQMHDGAG